MNAEQKQRIAHEISNWRNARNDHSSQITGDRMAALLQELVDAPEAEPFGYFKSEPFGWTDCAETDDGAIALYTAPSEPKPVARVTGYYAGCLSIATIDGRVLPAGTALYLAPPAPPALSVPDGWKHDCAGILANDVELWVDSCPHCGKPRPAAAPKTAEAPADVARDAERLRLFEQWTEMGYEHTKDPWFEVETESDVIEITNDERNGAIVPIAEVSTGFNGQIGIEQEANARRIVACVNACEGIPTGVLEKQGMVPIEQVTHDIEQQRDKLLAALTEIAELDILKYHHAYAIAKGAIEEIEALK